MHQTAAIETPLVQGLSWVPARRWSWGREAECQSVRGNRKQLAKHRRCDGSCGRGQNRCRRAYKRKGRWLDHLKLYVSCVTNVCSRLVLTRRNAPFLKLRHFQGMLQYGQSSVKKLVRVKVMSRKRPCANCLGNDSFSLGFDLEFARRYLSVRCHNNDNRWN